MKVLPDDIVLALKGHKVYASVSPAALGIWSDGEFGTSSGNCIRSTITHSQMPASERLTNFSRTAAWVPLLACAPPLLKVKRVKKEVRIWIVLEMQQKIPSSSHFAQ